MTERIILLLLLAVCAWQDLRKRTIYIWPVVICGCLGVFLQLEVWNDFCLSDKSEIIAALAAGMVPGIFLLVAAKLSGEQIGYGDGLLMTAAGLFLGFRETVELLFFASVAAGAVGCILMFLLKKKKTYTMPFVPFVLGVFVVMNAMEI